MEMKRLRMDWGYMGYMETGSGDPVVFVHGAGNRGAVWSELFDNLKDSCRVIAVDLPGHGKSSCVNIDSVDAYKAEILTFLEKTNLKNVTLVGHSMGGAITIKVTPMTDRISRCILVGTGAKLKVNPKLLDGLKTDFLQWAYTMARWSFSKGASEVLIDGAAEMMIEAGREVLYNDMYACSTYSGLEALKDLNKPTLIVCGEKDVMTPPDLSRELTEKIPGSKLELIPDSGHMVHQEKPEALANLIFNFLQG